MAIPSVTRRTEAVTIYLGYTFGENIGGTVSPPRGDPQSTEVSHGLVCLTVRWDVVR